MYPLCMKRQYEQIKAEERDQIAILLASGKSCQEIAKELQRNRSTVWREVKRNSPLTGGTYKPHLAQRKSEDRKTKTNTHPRINDSFIRWYVEDNLKRHWSPEQISGRLRIDYPDYKISHEAIYQYIYEDRPELKVYLARNHRTRRKRAVHKTAKVGKIPQRIGIENRPKEANHRLELGHWEGDSAVSRQSSTALMVLTERRTRFTRLKKISHNRAEEFSRAVIHSLTGLDTSLRKTITYDNGSENMLHQEVNRELKMESYFCTPYHSWEKGTVENTVGLVRRFLPKKTDFANVPDDQIIYFEQLINSRPRKCLNYLTPFEVINSSVALPC